MMENGKATSEQDPLKTEIVAFYRRDSETAAALVVRLRQQIELMSEEISHLAAFVKFAAWAIREGWEGDLCGGDVQDTAAELGLLVQTPYDPVVHGENIEADPGDPIYVFSDQARAIIERHK